MADLLDASHLTEFVPKVGTTDYWRTTCGETALVIAMGASRGFPATPALIDAVAHEMIAQGWSDPNGATYVHSLASYAQAHGYSIAYRHDEDDSWAFDDWHNQLLAFAGHKPICLFVGNGGALVDAETAAHDELGVRFHVICITGKQLDGYVASDGDNPQANIRSQVYNLATLQAARPRGMLILEMQVGTPMSTTIPQGWTDDGTTLTAPNGMQVIRGFRDHILADTSWNPGNIPLEAEHKESSQVLQMFRLFCLEWDELHQDWGVGMAWLGDETLANRKQIADLQQQIAALKAAPPIAIPVAPIVDPDTERALTLFHAVRAALA